MDNLLPLGGTFAGLLVESLIGRGGMGIVYRARQAGPARTVALKVLAPELDGDGAARRRFLAETELLAAVEHPHVVPIYDAGDTDGRLWLTMRLLEGPSLRSLVERRGPLIPARALELLAPVASALDAIHEAGLVHGDVGPANVLLDAHGEPYLTDFGIARRLGAPAERLGTLAYLAPERIVAAAPADEGAGDAGAVVPGAPDASGIPDAGGPAADRYAFAGLVLYVLTGRPPFEAPTADEVLRAHLEAPPPSASDRRTHLPEALDPVIARGLAKDPADRFASATELLDAVRHALARAPQAAWLPLPPDPVAATRPIAPSEPAASRRPRRPSLGAVAGAGLGLVATLLVSGSLFGFGLVPVAGSPSFPAAARSPGPGSGSPRASATARPTPTPTPVPTPTPTEGPKLGASSAVAQLRVLLPSSVRGDCRSAAVAGGALVAGGDLATPDAIAAVTCPLPDGSSGSDGGASATVRYVLFASTAALDATWSSRVASVATGNGRCDSGTPFAGRWQQPGGLFGLGAARTGRVACWFGSDGNARVDWTVDSIPVLATLHRSDEDLAAAYDNWTNGDLGPRTAD